MNQSAHKTEGVNCTNPMRFHPFTFTGNDPRKGWRIPLDEIKYNEQRDEEKEMSGGHFASERGEEPRSGMQYCSSLSFTNFGARYMDHELMTMWLSVDPLADKYPSISPYAYCAWNPVKLVDPDGREIHIVGDEQYRAQVYSLLNKLAKSGLAGKYLVYHALKDKKRTFTFIQPSEKNNHENNTLYVNGQNGEKTAVLFDANESGIFSADNGGVAKNALTTMAHELAHFVFPQDGFLLTEKGESSNIRAGEPIAVQWENRVRKDLGMDMRKKYAGRNVYNKGISESSKYRGWYNLSNVSGYLKPPTDVGSFKMKDMGDASPYFYKGGGHRIHINGNWKEARYTL